MNAAKTRKSKIIIQYTKTFDLSTCTLTPQRFRKTCFLTKRRQVVQNHPNLEGCLLFIQKKTVIKCQASLEVLSDAAFKESGPSPDSLGLTYIQWGRRRMNKEWNISCGLPWTNRAYFSKRAQERHLWEGDVWSDCRTDTGQGDKPLSQVKLTLFPALHQLFLFPPSLHRSYMLMAVAVIHDGFLTKSNEYRWRGKGFHCTFGKTREAGIITTKECGFHHQGHHAPRQSLA